MNLNDLKLSGTDVLNVSDSLKAPLLKISVKPNSTTVIPNVDDLIIYVDKSSTPTADRKTFIFELDDKLNYTPNNVDEFVLEPEFDGSKILMKAKVKRIDGTTEEVKSKSIILFEGVNYISTNYTNASLEAVYPKNADLVNFFLNNSIYGVDDKILTLDDIYFKDCFTDDAGDINAEFNELKVKCISSTGGNFRIDCMGNITCNTVTTTGSGQSIDFDSIYPVGSLYLSINNINPSTLFGGTWQQLTGDAYLKIVTSNAGNYSGTTSNHTIPLTSIPSHNHSLLRPVWYYSDGCYTDGGIYGQYNTTTHAVFDNVGSAGGGQPYYPYYYGVYVFVRTA